MCIVPCTGSWCSPLTPNLCTGRFTAAVPWVRGKSCVVCSCSTRVIMHDLKLSLHCRRDDHLSCRACLAVFEWLGLFSASGCWRTVSERLNSCHIYSVYIYKVSESTVWGYTCRVSIVYGPQPVLPLRYWRKFPSVTALQRLPTSTISQQLCHRRTSKGFG